MIAVRRPSEEITSTFLALISLTSCKKRFIIVDRGGESMNIMNPARIIRGLAQMKGDMRRIVCILMLAAVLGNAVVIPAMGQARAPLTDEQKAQRWATENELASLAVIERKLMIPMRDGVRIAADVYHPKDTSKKYPAI